MIVGFTGTQHGMSEFQAERLKAFLYALYKTTSAPHVFHHGDCIGADEQAHEIALAIGYEIVIHPPINPHKRAWCDSYTFIHEPKPYIERNHDIVDACVGLIVAPKTDREELRSGTWATYRYAVRKHTSTTILKRERS